MIQRLGQVPAIHRWDLVRHPHAGVPSGTADNSPAIYRWGLGGYGTFSIGITQVDDTIAYIDRQAEHHRQRPYQHECFAFLRERNIDYDLRYVLDSSNATQR